MEKRQLPPPAPLPIASPPAASNAWAVGSSAIALAAAISPPPTPNLLAQSGSGLQQQATSFSASPDALTAAENLSKQYGAVAAQLLAVAAPTQPSLSSAAINLSSQIGSLVQAITSSQPPPTTSLVSTTPTSIPPVTSFTQPSGTVSTPSQSATDVLPTVSKAPSKPSKDAGAIAGAAVGAGVGAALIAIVIMWLLLRPRRRRGPPSNEQRWTELKAMPPKAFEGGTGTVENARGGWQNALPQSADDATVKLWIRTLFDQVQMHVENFYSDKAVSPAQDELDTVAKLDTPYLPDKAQNLIRSVKYPTAIIKHCMLCAILAKIEPFASVDQTFLPADFNAARQPHSEGQEPGSQRDVYTQAFSQWRVLTAFLRSTPSSDPYYLQQRDSRIKRTMATFSTAFKPWQSNSHNDEKRTANLAEVLQNAAETGIKLFSQASSFEFDWRGETSDPGANRVTVSPAVLKVQDNQGKQISRAQVMVQKEVAKLQ